MVSGVLGRLRMDVSLLIRIDLRRQSDLLLVLLLITDALFIVVHAFHTFGG